MDIHNVVNVVVTETRDEHAYTALSHVRFTIVEELGSSDWVEVRIKVTLADGTSKNVQPVVRHTDVTIYWIP